MSVLVSLTICMSAAIGVLQLSGFYCVGQDVLTQNFHEVPLNTFLREGDNIFPLPPRHGGGFIMAVYNEPFYCVKMADNVLREF